MKNLPDSQSPRLSPIRAWRRPATITIATVALAALFTGCAADSGAPGTPSTRSEDPQIQELYEAARDAGESQVTVYQATSPTFEPLRQAFNEQFPGITVNAVSIIGAEAQARLQAEFSTGKHEADLVQSGLSDIIPESANGWFETFRPNSAEKVPEESVGPDYIETSVQLYGYIYNNQIVKEDSIPTTWEGLLDSTQWRGKVAIGDPLASNGTTQAMAAALTNGAWTEESLKKLKALSPHSFASSAAMLSSVATGQDEVGLLVGYDNYVYGTADGAPIGFSGPLKEGNPVLALGTGLVKNAPNPNAAKLYMAWLFSPEGQAEIAKVGQYSTVPGSPSPEGAPSLSDVNVLRLPSGKDFDVEFQKLLSMNKRVFG